MDIFRTRATIPQHAFLAVRSVAETSDDDFYEVTDRASGSEVDAPKLKARPKLAHHLQNDSSILTLAVGDRLIYAGTQGIHS